MKKSPLIMALCCFAVGLFVLVPVNAVFAQDCEEGSGC